MNKLISFIFVGLVIVSCQNINIEDNKTQEFIITTPCQNWTFYTDIPVLFSTNLKTKDLEWFSSIDGFIGKGNGFSSVLSEGNHVITVKKDSKSIFVDIKVLKSDERNINGFTYRINRLNQNVYIQEGKYNTIYYSLDGSAKKFCIINDNNRKTLDSNKKKKEEEKPIKKDFLLNFSSKNLNPITNSNINRSVNSQTKTIKDFYVINTKNQLSEPHIVKAEIYSSGNSYTLWKPIDLNIDEKIINELISNFEQLIFPRIQKIFGNWADINSDGKIAILLCPSINKEQVAIGYFNPQDLFIKNIDTEDESYNPYSNEMDIVYLAVPDSLQDDSYGVSSISATLAHELTHAVTFNKKTFQYLVEGNKNRGQEEIFLDEGLSHLSENLCGFSVSGGNIAFLASFLEKTASYSFCKDNIYKQGDTTGRRGAMLLFLSWLYRNAPDGNIFLQKILSSHNFGWDCIGEAYGIPTDTLFKLFIEDIIIAYQKDMYFIPNYDFVTGEPIEFFCNMGQYIFNDILYTIRFPKTYLPIEKIDILPYSFALIDSFDVNDITSITTTCMTITDSVFIVLFDNDSKES